MANELLEAALDYASRGWPVFPCRPDKKPYEGTNGVLDATTNPETIRQFWQKYPRANVAMDVGGAGMMVVEVDSYKPAFDPAKLAALNLPETPLRQRSPRGGQHLFFALGPSEIIASSADRIAPCVDVRSFHGYVLLPPSCTGDGAYSWEGEGKPAFRTDEMVRLSNSAREKSATRNEWLIEPDLPENVAAAEAWLAKDAKIAVEGQGGDHAAYATAAMMRSFGLSEPMALDAMLRVWNPRCVPEWEPDELETKVRNGYRYCTSDPGNLTPAYKVAKAQALFKPSVTELPSGREATAGRFRFVDRQGMAHIKPASWLIQDFLPAGAYAMLVGAPGTFKTFLALDLALTICTGFPEDPLWTAVDTGSVLYAAGEGRSSMANRVAAWEKLHWGGQPAEGFVLADPVPNVAEDWQPFIDGALQLSPDGYKLVVIDTVSRALAGVNESAQEFASKFTQKIEQLQDGLGCAVLALHHTGHEQKGRPRGSMVFIGDVDTLAHVERNEKEMAVSLTLPKQKDAEEWQRPKHIGLKEVQISEGVKSLAAVKASPPPAPERRKPAKGGAGMNDGAVALVLDAAVKAVLATNTLHPWTQRELAQAVAMRDEVDVDSKALQNTALVRLRETSGTYASRAYDPATKRWRHRE